MYKVIAYKKVKLTDDEYNEYQKLCARYTTQYSKGEDLFKDMFETNDDGLITYIKTLGNKQLSFEIMFFMMNLMQNQWLREIVAAADSKLSELDGKVKQLDALIAQAKQKLG